jgi:ankyrin repeat protein
MNIDRELIEAAEENNLPEASRLVSAGADVNATDIYGATALHWSCYRGHLQVFQALREHGADIEAEDDGGSTALHNASSNGHLAIVIELLDPNNSDGTITTILGKRTSRGGANIDARDSSGNTPLHDASGGGHLHVVKALVSGGANLLAANIHGELPIHLAVKRGNSEVSKYLLQHYYATTRRLPLHELVEDITWIGNPNSSGVPPHRAALDKNVLGMDDVVEILEYLVSRNPELVSSLDQDGSLPLHVACRRGASFTIVQSLVNLYEASVKSVTPQGDLPLFLACELPATSLDTVFLLIKLYPYVTCR